MIKKYEMVFSVAIGLLSATIINSGSPLAAGTKEAARNAGKGHYSLYCINCHGPNMVNIGTRSYDLRKFPLNDRPRFFKSVKDGKKDMPSWKDILSEEEILEIWEYVKTRGK